MKFVNAKIIKSLNKNNILSGVYKFCLKNKINLAEINHIKDVVPSIKLLNISNIKPKTNIAKYEVFFITKK